MGYEISTPAKGEAEYYCKKQNKNKANAMPKTKTKIRKFVVFANIFFFYKI